MDIQTMNFFTVFFSRVGTWFLTGPSLAEFCCNRRIDRDGCIYIGIINAKMEEIEARCKAHDIAYDVRHSALRFATRGFKIFINFYDDDMKNLISCSESTAQEIRKKSPYMSGTGIWKVPLSQTHAIDFQIPYKAGHILDHDEGWINDLEHAHVDWYINDVFFNEERKKNGLELLRQLYACGIKAGIDHAMFVGFGTALGIARHGDFIPNDRDMDMCINADVITPEQGLQYVDECKKAGLGEHRWRPAERRTDTNMPLWFSLGPKDPVSANGIKCCQWFFFKHGGYWWHSKGGQWIDLHKFNPSKNSYTREDAAIAKGIPERCIDGLVPYNFKGVEVLLPDNLGACLDEWYPGWMVPKEGASAHNYVMVVGKWEDPNTWRIG